MIDTQEIQRKIDEYRPGVSPLEQELERQLTAAGIAYEREYKAIPGRRYRYDFYFPDHGLLAEVQGGIWTRGAHGRGSGIVRDYAKINLAQYHDFKVLVFSPNDIHSGEALATIEAFIKKSYGG